MNVSKGREQVCTVEYGLRLLRKAPGSFARCTIVTGKDVYGGNLEVCPG